MEAHCVSGMVAFTYEPLEYLLKTGLPRLAEECFDQMDDGFYHEVYSPNWQMYHDIEARKDLGFLAMRDGDTLVGYAVLKINEDIHQKGVRIALLHDIYITETKRGYALQFFRFIEEFVRKMAVRRIDVAERLSFDAGRGGAGKFYEFIGFKRMEVIWAKVLENTND